MLNFGGSQLSFFFPMLHFGGPQHSFFFPMLHCVGLLLHPSPPATLFEHKIEVFVRFWGLEPLFSGFSSTKSRFLCFFGGWNPCFRAIRAQNRGFCALLGFETLIFGRFEHKIEVFVLFCPSEPSFSGVSSTKSRFLCSGRRGYCVGKGSLTSVNT